MTELQTLLRRWRSDPWTFLSSVITHEDGVSYGQRHDNWQEEDFRSALGDRRHVWWERPRGHAKTADMAVLALVELITGPTGQRNYATAVDQDQAGLLYDSLRGFVQRSTILSQWVRVLKDELIVEDMDSRLKVLPADAPGSWGLRPRTVFVDELHAWRGTRAEEFFQSLFSSLGKIDGARMVIGTTAGWDKASLCWRLRSMVQDDPAWVYSWRGQVASWVSAEFLEQQRRLLPDHVYRMLHQNEWSEAGGAFLTFSEVEAIFDVALQVQPECHEGRHWIVLDVGLSKDATAAAVLHKGTDGHLTVHDLATWRGAPGDRVNLADVEEWVYQAAKRRYSPARFQADQYQAVGLVQRLSDRGVSAADVSFTMQYRSRLFSNLLEMIREGRLHCFSHDDLKQELLELEFKVVNGNLRVDHRASGHDDHAVAVAMAALAATEQAKPINLAGLGMNLDAGKRTSPWRIGSNWRER